MSLWERWKRGMPFDGFITDIVPLDPPATPAELQWWKTQRAAYARKTFLRMGAPVIIVAMMTMLVSNPAKMLSVKGILVICAISLLAVVGTKAQMRQQEKLARDEALRWKRIRDDLRDSVASTQQFRS
jgi:hypothetical protein